MLTELFDLMVDLLCLCLFCRLTFLQLECFSLRQSLAQTYKKIAATLPISPW